MTDRKLPATDGLQFRSPLDELESILRRKIDRYRDAGDGDAVKLYEDVLELFRSRGRSPAVDDQAETGVVTQPPASEGEASGA